ncbi:hypothetical protein ZIOFF_017213 [Zingiber officinale]|uniref:Protein NEGATIVE REGULATOR OF RESISTANCE n=1 Tax=Zingiber officinale TaxID=94328 RepID=A0A8J5H4G4_ZINOF|nr:hypothetical protein ZIOFF_017213 [Zingiber officinale]
MLTSLAHFHKQEGRMDASSSQRKRRGGGDDRLPSKPRPACSSLPRGEKGPAASEEDVEEFFAILRRMRDASQFMSVGRGTAASAKWGPSFEWEDFFGGGVEKVAYEGGDGARAVTPAVDEEAKRPQGIDLNVDPGPEVEGVVVPTHANHDPPYGASQRLGVLSVHCIAVRRVADRGATEGSRGDLMSDGECS